MRPPVKAICPHLIPAAINTNVSAAINLKNRPTIVLDRYTYIATRWIGEDINSLCLSLFTTLFVTSFWHVLHRIFFCVKVRYSCPLKRWSPSRSMWVDTASSFRGLVVANYHLWDREDKLPKDKISWQKISLCRRLMRNVQKSLELVYVEIRPPDEERSREEWEAVGEVPDCEMTNSRMVISRERDAKPDTK